jgi:hypothetical protein
VTEWLVFAFIVLLVAVDDLLHELLASMVAARDFAIDRLKGLRQKLRLLVRGVQR